MSWETEYEAALITVWQELGRTCPADFREPGGEAELAAERAYYAAENALYKSGRIKKDDSDDLVLADRVTDAQEKK